MMKNRLARLHPKRLSKDCFALPYALTNKNSTTTIAMTIVTMSMQAPIAITIATLITVRVGETRAIMSIIVGES